MLDLTNQCCWGSNQRVFFYIQQVCFNITDQPTKFEFMMVLDGRWIQDVQQHRCGFPVLCPIWVLMCIKVHLNLCCKALETLPMVGEKLSTFCTVMDDWVQQLNRHFWTNFVRFLCHQTVMTQLSRTLFLKVCTVQGFMETQLLSARNVKTWEKVGFPHMDISLSKISVWKHF